MQLGYCREIAASSGGKYYPIADLTSRAVHDIVIQERERELLSSLQALRKTGLEKRAERNIKNLLEGKSFLFFLPSY
ncbi:hypothetical protein CW713_10160 [Methanophagales archaeon]|nr:MAG: hypothetical protein CW713_10160 [Methanophagales archaeon]